MADLESDLTIEEGKFTDPELFVASPRMFVPKVTNQIHQLISELGAFPIEHASVLPVLRGALVGLEYRKYKSNRVKGLANDRYSLVIGTNAYVLKGAMDALQAHQENVTELASGIWKVSLPNRTFRVDVPEWQVYFTAVEKPTIQVDLSHLLRAEGMHDEIKSNVPALWHNPSYTWNFAKKS